ncbi:MAG: DUF2924 domain-containing protein [Planctomycetes bacterium]|nr:DUF2924 domain-containing protein [Planctomycetota bacterium]
MGKEIAALKRMTVKELQAKHVEVFGEETRSHHKEYLVKRIAWRIQANAEGDLSERARQRAMELANDADLRTHAPRNPTAHEAAGQTKSAAIQIDHDARLPMPGAIVTREYKGKTIQVHVLPNGFEYEGEVYRTLSAVAKAVTGAHWNGYHFFGLGGNGKR